MKLGPPRNYHEGRVALRHYANLAQMIVSLSLPRQSQTRRGVVPAAAAAAAVMLWCDRILMAPQLRHYTSSSPPRHIMMADTPCRLDPYISCPFPWYFMDLEH